MTLVYSEPDRPNLAQVYESAGIFLLPNTSEPWNRDTNPHQAGLIFPKQHQFWPCVASIGLPSPPMPVEEAGDTEPATAPARRRVPLRRAGILHSHPPDEGGRRRWSVLPRSPYARDGQRGVGSISSSRAATHETGWASRPNPSFLSQTSASREHTQGGRRALPSSIPRSWSPRTSLFCICLLSQISPPIHQIASVAFPN
jgi:hypothetical protein